MLRYLTRIGPGYRCFSVKKLIDPSLYAAKRIGNVDDLVDHVISRGERAINPLKFIID